METEIPMLKKLPSFRPRFDSTVSTEDSDIEDPRYTSLKDLLLGSSPRLLGSTEGSIFDSSTISIRNELVKHAASAYIQSATIATSRNQSWLSELCEKLNSHAAARSCWHVYFRIPLRSCLRPVFRFLDYVVRGFRRASCAGSCNWNS